MDQRQVFLRDILTVLFKRKAFILTFVVAVFVLVFVGNYLWPETYESVAKVQVMRGRETIGVDPSVLQGTGMPMAQMSNFDVNTTIDLVYSNDVLVKVVENTQLDKGMAGGVMQAVGRAIKNLQYALRFRNEPNAKQDAADELRKAIQVEPVKDSYVLEIRCRMAKPDLAQKVLEELVTQFKEKHRTIYDTSAVADFFKVKYEEAGKELAAAQKELGDFRKENRIVSLKAEQDQLVDQYGSAQRLLNQLAETEAAAAQAAEGAASEAQLASALSRQTESTVVTELQLRLLGKIVERNRIENSLGPKHPQVLGINKEIDLLNERLKDAIATTKDTTQRKIAQIEGQMQRVNATMGELEKLERDVKLAGDSYEYFREKMQESAVYGEMGDKKISSIQVTSAATQPDNPISPRKFFNLVLALIGGIVGGVAISFFIEYLDHGLKTPEDVEYYLQVPLLASYFRSPYEALDPKQSHRLSSMVESAKPDQAMQMVMVSSAVGSEGSLRVARALAEAQADDPDSRTLLLDFVGDGSGEKPTGRGFMDVLDEECSVEDVVSQKGNLFVIGRGARAECPAYLWASEKMRALLHTLRNRYQRIIVHIAPATLSHDAVHMVRYADGILIVIRSDSTRREVVHRAIKSLGDAARDKILGAVLTERKQVIPQVVYRRM